MNLESVSIGELSLIADLPRFPSLRSWASKHRMTPIAASRLVKRMEDAFGVKLVQRSNLGVTLTAEGELIAKKASEVVRSASELREVSLAEDLKAFKKTLVFASRGFLNAILAGEITAAIREHSNELGIQFVDLSPEELRDALRASFVDFTLSFEESTLGKSWQLVKVGTLRWGVYARRDHPLLQPAKTSELRNYRLGHHAYWNGKRIVTNEGEHNDALKAIHNGFGAQTAFSALSVCSASDQLAFVPCIAARIWEKAGLVAEIRLEDAGEVEHPLFFGVESSRVSSKLARAVSRCLSRFLAANY